MASDNTVKRLRELAYRDAIRDAAALCEEAAKGSSRTEADRARNRTCLSLASQIKRLRGSYGET